MFAFYFFFHASMVRQEKQESPATLRRCSKLPSFLMTSEAGSFAQRTIVHRKPKIINEVMANNQYPMRVNKGLLKFKHEILHEKVRALTEDAEDVDRWNKIWRSFKGKTWLEIPWYFAESYFYRRLLEAVEYFQSGTLYMCDPFQHSKKKLLKECLTSVRAALDTIRKIQSPKKRFEHILHASLWGNRIDLSNIRVADEIRWRQTILERENLLINDFPEILSAFREHVFSHVAFLNDNVGMELGMDLFLADFLLENKWVHSVTFILKPYPFFVSDAMPKDLEEMLKTLVHSKDLVLSRFGKRMEESLSAGTFRITTDWFWASPHHFCEMPPRLKEAISRFDLVISKGDVNYRRLLSDRHWPYTTPIEDIVHYFPTSILILRTLKGEIIVGLKEAQAESIEAEDPEWLINGERGLIQYVKHCSGKAHPVN